MVPPPVRRHSPFLALAAALAALAGCAPEPVASAFSQSGELIALSGGSAGARGACITCHGLKGEGNGHLAPRLANLDPGYLAYQLKLFEDGLRSDPQMHWITRQLTEREQLLVSAYYAGQALPEPREADSATDACISAGAWQLYHGGDPRRDLQACADCHGADGEGIGRGNPPLSGQPAPYIATQLRKWQDGERHGDGNKAMYEVAVKLSEREVEDLAALAPHLGRRSPESPARCS